MMQMQHKRYEFVGATDARGVGVWISGAEVNERGTWLADIRYIVPDGQTVSKNWRENISRIENAVAYIFPTARRLSYKGGVAKFEGPGVKFEAYRTAYRDPAKDL